MSNKQPLISAIIIVNPKWFSDLKLLPGCLKSIKFVNEIILIPSEESDQINKLAKKYKAQIVKQQGGKFADWRNLGAQNAQGKWLLYVDADERVPQKLKQEIITIIKSSETQPAYAIPRSNKILGKEFRYAGLWPDCVLRLMQKDKLISWEGDLHEQPKIKGDIGYLKNHLLHIKFQNLENYVSKTIDWSNKEAELYIQARHPKMNTLRFIRLTINPFLSNLFKRLVIQKGFLDGTEGLIDAIYQSYSQFINFARLWELQSSNKLETKN